MQGLAYWVAVAIATGGCCCLCLAARHRPGRWTIAAARGISIVLAADAVTFMATPAFTGSWRVRTSLPLSLCDVALVVAAAACWTRNRRLAELTYFWGLTGTLQAVLTPDLANGFPSLEFFEYVVGHLGIVVAALYLVVGLRIRPLPGAVPRVFAITSAYTAFVGLFDALTGSDYMFLARRPQHWSVLNLLGPWPWYLVGAAAVALVLLLVLDAPFAGGGSEHDERVLG